MNSNNNGRTIIITYNVPHRKTFDLLFRLFSSGFLNVAIYAFPMKYKKSYVPLIKHRPDVFHVISTKRICELLNYSYSENYQELLAESKESVVLIGGAGIIDDEITHRFNVINSHPGYLPYVRGLDAFKWALFLGFPIGVTLHQVTSKIDKGDIYLRISIEILPGDSFHSLANRLYEEEIKLLVEGALLFHKGLLKAIEIDITNVENPKEAYPVRKRMPNRLEYDLFEKFNMRKINDN